MPRLVRTLEGAAAFVRRVGIALVYPNPDLVLPSLWEAVAGPGPLVWAVRDEDGRFVEFTPEMDRVWRWKDELAERGLACSGKHVVRVVSLVSPALLGALYSLIGRPGRPEDFRDIPDLTPVERDVAEPCWRPAPAAAPRYGRCSGRPTASGWTRPSSPYSAGWC
jgi:hypothetical protein